MSLRFGFVSTYPPTQCGLATFTASLSSALTASGSDVAQVVRLLESPQPPAGPDVVGDVVAGDPVSLARSLPRLNACDVVVVQHEFGIFGGPDGDEVLTLLAGLTVPSIVVLHTVLTDPSAHQREVLEAVVEIAGSVVCMTDTAHRRLLAGYRVVPDKVSVIAHGAPDLLAAGGRPTARPGPSHRPTVLTWGLLGPGKGIEWAVRAMAELRDLRPAPRYLVVGQTHPKVLAHQGEVYRRGLIDLAADLHLSDTVELDGRYLDGPSLAAVVSSADVVLLPYDSTEQVTSGVLIEAVAAGKPVVATRFPHAIELLATGAGVLVPQRDPANIAAALRRVLTDRPAAAAMARTAAAAAPGLRWSAVADEYRQVAMRLLASAETVAA
ncbi:glycosyltransferase [Nakamurella flava]|uniref:Glycosyltransferase n=1 Tax=Nakamurella flava TaxID=2576308 RepID=A0A4U6QKU8_9ACTN|nr:glycosyltransferase [Nakamurella flava]TKV60909.1 glycosyltransferase [Nakamurella flava]